MPLNRSLLLAPLTLMLMLGTAACHADDGMQASRGPVGSAAAIDALKAKTRKQLVDVPGGSFLMGDFGPVHNEEKLPYTGAFDDDVLRTVELDGFRMQAWKVTYADFDTYSDAVGQPRVAQSKVDQSYRHLPDIAAGVSWTQAVAYFEWIGKQIDIPMTLPNRGPVGIRSPGRWKDARLRYRQWRAGQRPQRIQHRPVQCVREQAWSAYLRKLTRRVSTQPARSA